MLLKETPTPIEIDEKNKNEKNSGELNNNNSKNEILEQKNFELKFGNIIYKLKIQIDLKYIYFKLIELNEDDIPPLYYSNKTDLNTIISAFNIFPDTNSNTKRIILFFHNAYMNNKLYLNIKGNNISIIIKKIKDFTEDEYPINLTKTEITINEKIDIILNHIKYLKNNKNILLNDAKLLKKIIKEIQTSTYSKIKENERIINILNENIMNSDFQIKKNKEEIKSLKNEISKIKELIKNSLKKYENLNIKSLNQNKSRPTEPKNMLRMSKLTLPLPIKRLSTLDNIFTKELNNNKENSKCNNNLNELKNEENNLSKTQIIKKIDFSKITNFKKIEDKDLNVFNSNKYI